MKKKKINGEFKKDLIRKGIIALCKDSQVFRNQGDIIKALKKSGIVNVNQVDVSRTLAELNIRQRENGVWVMDYESSKADEIEKLSNLFKRSKELPRIFRVEVLVIRTDDYQNTMIAQQIKNAFPDRVITTFCPNEFDIIIFYRTGKKDKSFSKEIREIRNKIKKSRESKIKEHKAP